MNLSERCFATYLNLNGYLWEFEPELGPSTRPDFLVSRGGVRMLCEVKSFEHGDFFENATEGELITRDARAAVKPIRGQLREAARKFRPHADSGLPLVVILVNDKRLHIGMHANAIVSAMYGDVIVRTHFDEPEVEVLLQRNGQYTASSQYVSGAGVLRLTDLTDEWIQQWKLENDDLESPLDDRIASLWAGAAEAPQGIRLSVDIFEAASPSAVPVPRNVFTAEYDQRYAWTGHQVRLLRRRGDRWSEAT